jgi:ParB-like chromosome segregation protein Spo0J
MEKVTLAGKVVDIGQFSAAAREQIAKALADPCEESESYAINKPMIMSTKRPVEFHPLSNIFPLIDGTAFQELVADIKAHGLHEPIWLYEGKVLDGRNRYRACVKAKVEPSFRDYDGNDPLAFVVSLNLKRRHLNASQLAFVALDIERVEAELAKKRMLSGKKLDPVQQIGQGRSAKRAAKTIGVNHQYVSDAKRISKKNSDVADMVRAGKINLGEGKKLIALPDEARPIAIKALAGGADIQAAVRAAKKLDYNKRIQVAKPKRLEGKYRIIYADPPWTILDSSGRVDA